MPIIVYWKHGNYVEDTSEGLAYHFNSRQKRLHSCTSIGDDVFVVSGIRTGDNWDMYLLAHLIVESQEINPSGYEYGSYRVYGDEEQSRYFSPNGQPLTPVLSSLTSIEPLSEDEKHKWPQKLQTIRQVSETDARKIKDFADTLPLHSESNSEKNTVPSIGKEQIDVLLAYLPIFEQEGFHVGEWITKKGDFPYYAASEEVDRFESALYDQNIVFSFNWPAWEEGKHYVGDNEALADADLLTLRKLLTAHVRSSRFVEGHFAAMVENGHVTAILRRLQQLRAQMM